MLALIKGAGDIATGIAHRLKICGFTIVMTEISKPTVIRRTVAFASAVSNKTHTVEGITAVCVNTPAEALNINSKDTLGVIVDENADCIKDLAPDIVIDSILAKRNISTKITDANIVIGIGPGFCAGLDCHAVIETMRGHDLGRAIYSGEALKNTGIPGDINGHTALRLLRAPCDGTFLAVKEIGDKVFKNETVAYVNDIPITTCIDGILRGLIASGNSVYKNMKAGDIDPRCEAKHCYTISDKARSVAGGVLESIFKEQKIFIPHCIT